jgi:hypothetical protein
MMLMPFFCCKRLEDFIVPSTTLQKTVAEPWLLCIESTEIVLNALTALINPHLYDAGFNAIQTLQSPDGVKGVKTHEHVQLWSSVYSGISVIANRLTPRHYDVNASAPWYDLLASCGTHTAAEFLLPDIRARLSYTPRTVVALCGKCLSHEVNSWDGGERICVAHYMRNMVHDRLGIDSPNWCRQNIFLRHMHSDFVKGQFWHKHN